RGRGVLGSTYNWLLRIGDDFIWAMVTRRLQGSDLPDWFVADVGPHPIPGGRPDGALPEELDAALLERAREGAVATLDALRQQFAQAIENRLTGLDFVESLHRLVTGDELIHTSYFPRSAEDSNDVTVLVALHIARHGALHISSCFDALCREAPGP